MYWYRTSTSLPVIYWYCLFAASIAGLRLANAGNKCTHGGILNGVFLHGGIQSRNDTIFSNVPSMEVCINKCCKTSKCDLAMKIGNVCHAVKCQDDDSCQITHRRKGTELRAEISFITKGEEVNEEAGKDFKAISIKSRKSNNQQSMINKRPTLPLSQNFPKTSQKSTKPTPASLSTEVEKDNEGQGTGASSFAPRFRSKRPKSTKSSSASLSADKDNNSRETTASSFGSDSKLKDSNDRGTKSLSFGTSPRQQRPKSAKPTLGSLSTVGEKNDEMITAPSTTSTSRFKSPKSTKPRRPSQSAKEAEDNNENDTKNSLAGSGLSLKRPKLTVSKPVSVSAKEEDSSVRQTTSSSSRTSFRLKNKKTAEPKTASLTAKEEDSNDLELLALSSGSGSGLDDGNEENEDSESGLNPFEERESSGTKSKIKTTDKQTEVPGKGTSSNAGFLMPHVLPSNIKKPSASRSAIPTPSELSGLDNNLEQSIKSYSFDNEIAVDGDTSGDEVDTSNREEISVKDIGDSEKANPDITTAIKAENKAKPDDSGTLNEKDKQSTKIGKEEESKSLNIESTNAKVKNEKSNSESNENLISNFEKAIDQSAGDAHKNINKEVNKTEVDNGSGSKLKTTPEESQTLANDNSVYDYKSSNIDVNVHSGMKESTGLTSDSTNTAKESEEAQKDFNDVTRGVISVVKNSGKFSEKGTKSSLQKKGEHVTPLQKQLSTLFTKDVKNQRRSFYKPSKKSSFEKIQKIQQRREKRRRLGKNQPSLSILYPKKSENNKIKYLVHRFSEWRGWKRDQFLKVPKENTKCKRGVTIRGATLRGGILAGDFKTVGIVTNQHACVNSCCKNKRCDVALMLGKECFNVKCYSSNLCGIAPATAIFDEVTPIITYVRGHIEKRSTVDEQESRVLQAQVNELFSDGYQKLNSDKGNWIMTASI